VSHTPAVDDDPPSFVTVLVAEDVGQTVTHVNGDVDLATCEQLRDAIGPLLRRGEQIVLDLSGVGFMGSSCLTVLVQARTTLHGTGGSLILRNPSELARRLLSLTGLAEHFDIEISHSRSPSPRCRSRRTAAAEE
jgi:anti-anti-sigma factor